MPAEPPPAAAAIPSASLIQPVASGALAAFVGFASSFAVLLAGFTAVGASPEQAASGLFAVTAGMGLLSLVLSVLRRQPITIAWSTAGGALLVATAPLPPAFRRRPARFW